MLAALSTCGLIDSFFAASVLGPQLDSIFITAFTRNAMTKLWGLVVVNGPGGGNCIYEDGMAPGAGQPFLGQVKMSLMQCWEQRSCEKTFQWTPSHGLKTWPISPHYVKNKNAFWAFQQPNSNSGRSLWTMVGFSPLSVIWLQGNAF